MTLFEWFVLLPLWAKILIGIPLALFALEVFILPFRLNVAFNRQKNMETILRAILNEIGAKKKDSMDAQEVLSLLLKSNREKKKEKQGDG